MIRRRTDEGWLLFAQDDHARLASEVMKLWGGGGFFFPQHPEDLLFALSEHDCGWREADASPGLNGAGEPADFTEAAPRVQTEIWRRSFLAHGETRPAASALIALHFNRFNNRTLSKHPNRWSLSLKEEIGEFVKKTLGASPCGIAPETAQLLKLLQIGDALSLALCHAWGRFEISDAPLAGGGAGNITVLHKGGERFSVKPWPFLRREPLNTEPLKFEIRFRRTAGHNFKTTGQLAESINSRPPGKEVFCLYP